MNLRQYQDEAREAVRAAFNAGHRRVLLVMPTGAGKTVTFCDIATRTASRGKRVCILVHRAELIRQTSRALREAGAEHGIIKSGMAPNRHALIQVASVQTLVNRLDRYSFDLIIVDEAHHTSAATYAKILAPHAGHVLGVTATPCRADGTGLSEAGYTELILGPDIDWLTEHGFLAPAEVYAPGGIDVAGVRQTAGDYNRGQLTVAADKPTVTGCAIEHYRRFADRQPAIAFCVSVAHAEHVAADFAAAGYRAASIDGRMGDDERAGLINSLGTGRLDVLTSCDLISEGVDVPVVTAGIFLRPTQSRALWYQQIGRCLRIAPGKSHAVLLDHAGNTARHGVPWGGDLGWTLEGTRRKPRSEAEPAVSVRICGACCRAHAPAPVCPFCGFEYPPQPREVTAIEGELIKLDAQYQRAVKRDEQRKCRTLEELEALARQRGYKPGWAQIQWEFRQSYRRKASA